MNPTLLMDWVELAARWLHVVTAIAWIGSSFYFIALDLGLHRDRALASGADGEAWQVHGGGFYHIQKYLVAPAAMPAQLTWFKWESYATWLTGFLMMVLVYYMGADLFLIDPEVRALTTWQAIGLSAGSLALGWVVYDLLCRSPLGESQTGLMLVLFAVLVAMSWGYAQLFSGRAALLHLGAFTATIMSANVFLKIIPNQKVVVADLIAGRKPDPKYGKIAKQRSLHNNYLTLPVIFLMLSNHYPLAFASHYNWLIAALVFLMGVSIRHFFNTHHAHKGYLWWTWAVTAALFVLIVWLSTFQKPAPEGVAALPPAAQRFAQAPEFEEVQYIVMGRCAMCHAAEPGWDGIAAAPRGVHLETPEQIALMARKIYLHAGMTHAMPPANVSFIEPAERALIVAWYEGARG